MTKSYLIKNRIIKKGREALDIKKINSQIIGKEPCIYALYQDDNLYYVGKAKKASGRIKEHKENKHKKKWNKFSIFFVKNNNHLDELEALILNIVDTNGNKQQKLKFNIPVNKDKSKLVDNAIDDHANRAKGRYLSKTKNKKRINIKSKKRKTDKHLKWARNLPISSIKIVASYKGQKHKASLFKAGYIKLNDKRYYSPSYAGKTITGKECNGLVFWKTKNKEEPPVELKELKQKLA